MWGNRRLGWLVTAHLFLWFFSAVLVPFKVPAPFGLDEIFLVPLFAVTFCQISLLGIWAVFSHARVRYRLLGLVIGTACLEAALDIHWAQEFLLLASTAMTLTAVSLLVGRRFGVCLVRRDTRLPQSCPEPGGLKFSIRGLMVLVATVAVFSAAAKSLRESSAYFAFYRTNVFWTVCLVAGGIVALWAATGLGRTLRRCALAVGASAVLGAFFAYAANAHRQGWIYIITIMVLHSVLLLGSLRIVQSCGYRLERRAPCRVSPLAFTFRDPRNADPEVPTS